MRSVVLRVPYRARWRGKAARPAATAPALGWSWGGLLFGTLRAPLSGHAAYPAQHSRTHERTSPGDAGSPSPDSGICQPVWGTDLHLLLSGGLLRLGLCLLYTSPSPRDRTRSRMP